VRKMRFHLRMLNYVDKFFGVFNLNISILDHNRFKAVFPRPPGSAGARRETSGLCGARED